jgi:hypothetical protein
LLPAWQRSSRCSRYFIQPWAPSSYLPRGTMQRNLVRTCRPEFLGWIFAVLGSLLFLTGIAMAICILIAGRSLALRKRYLFVLVMGCIECLFIPFGTILGVFTVIVLSRESVKALFSTA